NPERVAADGGALPQDAPRVASARARADAEPSRAVHEFNRRFARLIERQKQHVQIETCERQSIILENLVPGVDPSADMETSTECRMVRGREMIPVWLDLGVEGERQLALMRWVSTEELEFCIIQGVLFDWQLLKSALEHEVQDLLPGARIEPVAVPVASPRPANMLHTIPAQLV